MPLATFHIYNPDGFKNYILNSRFSRTITVVQNHHTWLPNYASINSHPSEMYWLDSMRTTHMRDRGWADIGQNITVFPSGNIGLCRPIDVQPAGVYGANKGAICIENLGNFDTGKDQMTATQKDSILLVNALLCTRFGLQPVPSQVVYHHWFDATGKRFPDNRINSGGVTTNDQKTCPGNAFFGGNTISAAINNFYPGILAKMGMPQNAVPAAAVRLVDVTILNVRKGPGTTFGIARKLMHGTAVTVHAEQADWSKISNTVEEWGFSSLLQ